MTSIESQLKDLRDLLKNKIENKFNVTCTSTTILGLIGELQELIRIEINPIDDVLPPELSNHALAEKIVILANYLVEVLNCASISADIADGFTTLVNKINDIESPITPTISISRNKTSVSSGSSVTLTATVTGDVDHGTPAGSVQFFEGTSTTPFKTISSTSSTTTSTATFKTTRSKTVSSDTTYKYSAKFLSSDNSKYNDSEKSSQVSVKWKALTKLPSQLSATASFQGNYLYWSYSGGAGTVMVGLREGEGGIGMYTTSSGSGTIQLPSTSSITLYFSDTGNESYEAGSISVTATR